MRESFTIMEAQKLNRNELEARLTKCREDLESLGMEHVDACKFIGEVGNIMCCLKEMFMARKGNSGKYRLET